MSKPLWTKYNFNYSETNEFKHYAENKKGDFMMMMMARVLRKELPSKDLFHIRFVISAPSVAL